MSVPSNPVKVLLADGHRLALIGLRKSLAAPGDFKIVGEALTTSEVMPLVRRKKPDVVILDTHIKGHNAFACLDLIKQHHAHITTIVLSASANKTTIAEAFARGANAYVIKSVNPVDLPGLIRHAMTHTTTTPAGLPQINRPISPQSPRLTDRELTILAAVAEGISNKEIAQRLGLSHETVKFHLSNLYRKLLAATRTEAIRSAYRHGLIEHPRYRDDDDPLN